MRRIGDFSELMFAARAIEHKLMVSFPFGSPAYDVIVDNGLDRYRVQVKSSDKKFEAKYGMKWEVSCRVRDGNGGFRSYNSDDCDFIAIHLKSIDTWYILRPKDSDKTTITFYPELDDCHMAVFKEAWWQLGGSRTQKEQEQLNLK